LILKDELEVVDVEFFRKFSVLLRKRFNIQRHDFKGFFSIIPLVGENKTFSVLLGNGSSLLNNDATILELKYFLHGNSYYVNAYEAHDVRSSKVMS
jgi:hypothetical protein